MYTYMHMYIAMPRASCAQKYELPLSISSISPFLALVRAHMYEYVCAYMRVLYMLLCVYLDMCVCAHFNFDSNLLSA